MCFVVERTCRKSVAVGCVNQPFRDSDCRTEFLLHEVRHLCKMDLVDAQKCGQFVSHVINFLITALKWFSCKAAMSTRWSTRLLLLTNCISKREILAELNVESVSATADIPNATKSRKHLSMVTTSYCGSVSSMLLKSVSLLARHDLLISATSSTCVLKGSGHISMDLWYLSKMSAGVSVSLVKLKGTLM